MVVVIADRADHGPRQPSSLLKHVVKQLEASMKPEEIDNYATPIVGRQLFSVEKKDYSWFFGFGPGVSLATESPWRFIEQGRIVVSSEDHGQQFGLPTPVDVALELKSRAAGRAVEAASVASGSGDLTIQFPGPAYLQLLQLSSGMNRGDSVSMAARPFAWVVATLRTFQGAESPNNSMQRTALRAAADTERWVHHGESQYARAL